MTKIIFIFRNFANASSNVLVGLVFVKVVNRVLCEIWTESFNTEYGTAICLSPNMSVSLCQYHSTGDPYSPSPLCIGTTSELTVGNIK